MEWTCLYSRVSYIVFSFYY